MNQGPLYKIMSAELWATAEAEGRMPWAPVDVADGFVHLSTAHQVRETAEKHFQGQTNLVLLTLDGERLAPGTLLFEPSRGGALFPHVYGDVPLGAVIRIEALPIVDGGFAFPASL